VVEEMQPTINPDAEPRKSTQAARPSAAGAALKGIPLASEMDWIRAEIWASDERVKRLHTSGLSPLDDTNALMLSSDNNPQSYKDAMSQSDSAGWTNSIAEELQSFKSLNIWTLIPRSNVPVGQKVIPSKAVFHYKPDEHRNVVRHKTRIVVKGFAHKQGIDFNDTFAPVAHMEMMCTILHISVSLNWDIH
jgi:hypothetical protein